MKNKVKLLAFLSVIYVFSLLSCQPAKGPWIELDHTDTLGGFSSYDQDHIKKSDKDRMQVRVRTVYYGESRDYITRLFDKKYEKFAYVINLEEVNCAKKEYQILSTTLYDTGHQALHTQTYEKENWEKIPTDSDIEELSRALCQ